MVAIDGMRSENCYLCVLNAGSEFCAAPTTIAAQSWWRGKWTKCWALMRVTENARRKPESANFVERVLTLWKKQNKGKGFYRQGYRRLSFCWRLVRSRPMRQRCEGAGNTLQDRGIANLTCMRTRWTTARFWLQFRLIIRILEAQCRYLGNRMDGVFLVLGELPLLGPLGGGNLF